MPGTGCSSKRILDPILERFEIPSARRPYYIAYYVEGIAAIVKEWLRHDCGDFGGR